MNVKQQLFRSILGMGLSLSSLAVFAQTKTVNGNVSDEKGAPIAGASVKAVGTTLGTFTSSSGTFQLSVPENVSQLEISYVGYVTQTIDISGQAGVAVQLKPSAASLNDIVVIGYGTARRKDLTGSVASVSSKDFNKGTFASPDQMLQGKAAGIQIISNSGQPGGTTTVKIRGNSAVTGTGSPLYVLDGVPLDGRVSLPAVNVPVLNNIPGGNGLNFINPTDIASVEILKDASATAIYGSRAAYGVVLMTSKKGQVGQPKLDVSASVGTSSIMRKIKMLDASEYRQALQKYDLGNANDFGGNVDAMDAVLRHGITQNYNAAISGGTENGKYRLSMGILDQQGIIKKSDFKKYSMNFNSNFLFLENKRLGIDLNIIANVYQTNIPPITNDAGFENSLIGEALQWNPTEPLYKDDGTPNLNTGSNPINPVALQQVYNDKATVTTLLGSISPYYKITNDLTYRVQYSIYYSPGSRNTYAYGDLNINTWGNIAAQPIGPGWASIGNVRLVSQQVTHTLNYTKEIASKLNLNAVVGYEYLRYDYKGSNMNGIGPKDGTGFSYGLDPTDFIQYSDPSTRNETSFHDPKTELQSYFGRVQLNYKDRYMITGTLRSDGSTKFGENNRYGYFPSVAGAWDMGNESFFHSKFVNQLKLRAGWGKTGNQEFPAGASQTIVAFNNGGSLAQTTAANADLKWQSDEQYDFGLDFSLLHDRIYGSADYFHKKTTGLLYPQPGANPVPGTNVVQWKNLPGIVLNKGFEVSVNAQIINEKDFTWSFGANATFLKNRVSNLSAPIYTGQLNGQGVSGTLVETIRNGLPINAFWTRSFKEIDPATGLNVFTDPNNPDSLGYQGDPNPHTLLGLTTTLTYRKFSLTANANGAFGYVIYNNTFNNVVNINNLRSSRNVAQAVYEAPVQESLANSITSSSRFLESGNYLKMANITLSYTIGDIGKIFKNASVYVTGQNLFVITKYKGFDPEINTDKSSNGVPSRSIDYEPYPSARTFTLGVNLSL